MLLVPRQRPLGFRVQRHRSTAGSLESATAGLAAYLGRVGCAKPCRSPQKL